MQQGRIYPKYQIETLERQLKELHHQAEALQQQHEHLQLQHTIATSCCETLHTMRSGKLHKGWSVAQGGILSKELPLLLDLGFQVDMSQLLEQEQQEMVLQQQQQQQQRQACQSSARVLRPRSATAPTPHSRSNHVSCSNSTAFCWEPHATSARALAAAGSGSSAAEGTAAATEAAATGAADAAKEQAEPHAVMTLPRVFLWPGEFQGPLKFALAQPPYPGGCSDKHAG